VSLYETEVKVEHFEATALALRKFEPGALKRMKSSLRKAGKQVSNLANARAPLAAQGGFGVKITERGKSAGMKVYARAGSKLGKNAAIFEFAGKPGNVVKPQGRAMIDWLSGYYGSPGRFMWSAWGLKKATVLAEVEGIWKTAESELQAAMDRAGVS
jgi:hypothetical protein